MDVCVLRYNFCKVKKQRMLQFSGNSAHVSVIAVVNGKLRGLCVDGPDRERSRSDGGGSTSLSRGPHPVARPEGSGHFGNGSVTDVGTTPCRQNSRRAPRRKKPHSNASSHRMHC